MVSSRVNERSQGPGGSSGISTLHFLCANLCLTSGLLMICALHPWKKFHSSLTFQTVEICLGFLLLLFVCFEEFMKSLQVDKIKCNIKNLADLF